MNWFPQIGRGSLVQFPLRRKRTWRTIANELENGERIALPDHAASEIEWQLTYQDLTDSEAASLNNLFAISRGTFGAFGFADPLANLLAWSEDLSRPDWQAGLLSATAGANDPLGTGRAWTLTNSAPGSQALTQTVGIPGDYVGCFSLWFRGSGGGTITLQRDGIDAVASIGPAWKQTFVSGRGISGAAFSNLSLVVPAAISVDVFGLQYEAQPYASKYKATAGESRIYQETYFGSDELTMTNTGPGLSACNLTLISRV